MRITVCIFLMFACNTFAQTFTNPDLEGSLGMSSTPPGWFSVSFSDIHCQAYTAIAATPDVTGVNGPVPAIGVSGVPYSGNSFVSGLISGDNGVQHHEGIRQTVTNLTPGKPYTIRFYQTVVRQDNQLDTSGSWSVFMDNSIIGTSSPSSSNLAFDNSALLWEERCIFFTPTQNQHNFKFLPSDDDNSQIVPYESLRMGIDHISITPDSSQVYHDTICSGELATIWAEGASQYHWVSMDNPSNVLSYDSILHISPDSTSHYLCINNLDTNIATVTVLNPPTLDLGDDQYLCAGDTAIIHPNVHNSNTHLWDDGSTQFDLHTALGGNHWMIAENECGHAVDSINIFLDSIAYFDFGFDSLACKNQPVMLSVTYPNAFHLWSNGSTSTTILVQEAGVHELEISNECGTSIHTFDISFYECHAKLEMPNVFSPQNDGINDHFLPITHEHFNDFHLVILNRWGETLFESTDPAVGWNGEIKGTPAGEGVYFWKVVYSNLKGDNMNDHGSFTLVR